MTPDILTLPLSATISATLMDTHLSPKFHALMFRSPPPTLSHTRKPSSYTNSHTHSHTHTPTHTRTHTHTYTLTHTLTNTHTLTLPPSPSPHKILPVSAHNLFRPHGGGHGVQTGPYTPRDLSGADSYW
jgi:hypothetical protein